MPPRSSGLRYREYRRKLKESRAKRPAFLESFNGSQEHKQARQRSRSFTQLLAAFWGLLAGHRRTIVFVLLAASFSTMLGLAPLYGTKIVFDSVLNDKPVATRVPRWIHLPSSRLELLTVVSISMVVLAAASESVSLWCRWETTRVTKRMQAAVRKKVFDHAVRLPLHRVYELKSGGVASILREDAGGLADLVLTMIYTPWRAIIQLVGSLTILIFVDWRLLLGSLVLLPTVWFTHRTWVGRVRPIFRDIRLTRQQVDSHATEAFGGMRVVRSFSRQKTESAIFTVNGHLMARQEIFAWWWLRGVDFTWAVLIPFATAVLLYWGGNQVLTDMEKIKAGTISPAQALTLGDLVMFLAYLAALLGPVAALAGSATGLQNSLSGMDRILDLLAEPVEMPSKPGAMVLDRKQVAGRITLQNVSFAYNDSASPVLHEISLDVNPNEIIALVGPSGAGKTTLCNLIARFYDPTEGAVLLDGRNLRDITADSFRRLLGIVEQDTFLFDGTIAENIAYGRRGANLQEIIHVATLANADEFISKLPQGYDSLIGERGVKLSGGQRQRLTIARAILADPRILILDEATSNLDTESERLIQNSLQALMTDRTSFVIAHRLSTIIHADRILVLEKGRIVEQGRHEELMQASGRYREMVDLQTNPPTLPNVEKQKHRTTGA